MFQYSIRHGLSVLLLLITCSQSLIAADAVTIGINFDEVRAKNGETSTDPNRIVKTDVTNVAYDPQTEAGLLPRTAQSTIAGTLAASPGATINLLCTTGGHMTAAGCGKIKDEIARDNANNGRYTSETIEGMEPMVPPGADTGSPPQNVNAVNPPPPPPRIVEGAAGGAGAKPPSDGKLLLSIIRAVTAGGAVMLTMTVAHPDKWMYAAGAAVVAAVWSGGMQAIQRPYGNWLRQDKWLSFKSPESQEFEAFKHVDTTASDATSRYLRLLKKHTVDNPTFDVKDLQDFVRKEGPVNPFEAARDASTRYAIVTDPGAKREFAEILASGNIDWDKVKSQMSEAVQMHEDATKAKSKLVPGKHFAWHSRAGFLKSLTKKAITSSMYALVMSSAFYGLDLNKASPLDGEQAFRNGQAVVESLYTQTAWETLISEKQEKGIAKDPNNKQHVASEKWKSGKRRVLLSFVNVMTGAMNVAGLTTTLFGGDIKTGFIMSGVVGTAGIITYGQRWVPDSWKKAAGATLCRAFGILAAPFRGKPMPGEPIIPNRPTSTAAR